MKALSPQVWRLENSFGWPPGGAWQCTETIVLTFSTKIRQIFYDSHKLYLKQVLEGAAASTLLTMITESWVMLVPRSWTGQLAKMVA